MSMTVLTADYADPAHAHAVLHLLDCYARDPMGGAAPLHATTRATLIEALAGRAGALSLLARVDEAYVGLANCFEGFSTFAARPLLNIHDLYVAPEWRGRGVVSALFAAIERLARARNCCKLTLEVLEGNARAKAAYRRVGFGADGRHPQYGGALFWQKSLAD